MKHRKILFAALVVAATSVHAGNWYGMGMISRSSASLDSTGSDNALTAAGVTGLSSSSSGKSNKWRLQLGYQFNDYLAVEGGYIDLGQSNYSASYTGGSASGSLKASGPDVVALAMMPVGQGVSLYGELGLIDAKVQSQLSAAGSGAVADNNSSQTKVRPVYGLGGIYNMTDATALRVGVERVTGLGDNANLGSMNVNMYSVGLAYKF